MGSFAELDPFAHLSRLGDLTKEESKTFGFSLTIKVHFDQSDTDILRAFQGWGFLYPLPRFLTLIFIGSPILGKVQHSK